MGLTPKTELRTPSENTDPFHLVFDNEFGADLDEWLDASRADLAAVLIAAGAFSWDAASNQLTTPAFDIYSARYGNTIHIAAGTITINDGEIVYVDGVPRPYDGSTVTLTVAATTLYGGSGNGRDKLPVVYRSGDNLYWFQQRLDQTGGGLPTDYINMSGGGNVSAADSGKSITAADTDVLVLPDPAPGLYYFFSCSGGGAAAITVDATVNPAPGGSAIYGPFQAVYGAAWDRMKVYGMPCYALVQAAFLGGAWVWHLWNGSGHVEDADTPGNHWYFSDDLDFSPSGHTHDDPEVLPDVSAQSASANLTAQHGKTYTNTGATADIALTFNSSLNMHRCRVVKTNPGWDISVLPTAPERMRLPDGTDLDNASGGIKTVSDEAEVCLQYDPGGTPTWIVTSISGEWERVDNGTLLHGADVWWDTRGNPETTSSAAAGGGTTSGSIDLGVGLGIMAGLRVTAAGNTVNSDIEFFSDAAMTHRIYLAAGKDCFTSPHEDRSSWGMFYFNEDLENRELHYKITNNGANPSTYDIEVVGTGRR